MFEVAYNQKRTRQSSIQLLCAVIFFPVANVFGAELDCWFIFMTPHFLRSCSVSTGFAAPTFLWLHVGPCTEGRLPLRHADRYRCCLDSRLFGRHRSVMRCSVKALTLKERPNSRINNFNGSRSRSTAPLLDWCRRPLCLWLEVFSAFFSLKFSKWWSFSGHLKYTFQKTHLHLKSLTATWCTWSRWHFLFKSVQPGQPKFEDHSSEEKPACVVHCIQRNLLHYLLVLTSRSYKSIWF